MADFARAAATAKRLIEANGRAVTLFKVNRTPDDPAKPWRGTSSAPATIDGGLEIASVKVAFVPASGSGFGKTLADRAESLDVQFQQVGLLATDSLPSGVTFADVEAADSLRDGADVWKITVREHLRPASQSILFLLGLSK